MQQMMAIAYRAGAGDWAQRTLKVEGTPSPSNCCSAGKLRHWRVRVHPLRPLFYSKINDARKMIILSYSTPSPCKKPADLLTTRFPIIYSCPVSSVNELHRD